MAPRKRDRVEKVLTEVELELMQVIWQLGECSIRQVCDAFAQERDLAYTSVATIMNILEKKGVLKSLKSDRVHTYRALLTKPRYEEQTLKKIAVDLFDGDPASMVMRLLDSSELNAEELNRLRQILNEKHARNE